ncbi:MAG: pyridoxal-phosphate dependent enzyme, partial [Planctomycetales bacterium]|nr:pyridoxal-phosphate dependent enzyme [Planctomycetales bacterium]
MQVDESRGDRQAAAVDAASHFAGGKLADGDNSIALDGDVAGNWGAPRAVVNLAVGQQNVGVDGIRGSGPLRGGSGEAEPNGGRGKNRDRQDAVHCGPIALKCVAGHGLRLNETQPRPTIESLATLRATPTPGRDNRQESPVSIDIPPAAASSASATAAPASAQVPDAQGRFGSFGGRYVPETLVYALDQLEAEYAKAQADAAFQAELDELLKNFVGRPSPLYHARRLSEQCGGAQIWFKREDLNHTGAHKINNTLGQALLTLRMGKTRVIAETGAG